MSSPDEAAKSHPAPGLASSSDAEQLRAALEASGTGTFRWDTRANMVWSDRWMNRLFGTPFTEGPKPAGEFLARVHPLDRAGVTRAVVRCADSGGLLDVEYRIVRPDGGIGWLHARGQTLAGADGKPECITGICADVTDRRAQQDQLRTMAETMRSSFGRRPPMDITTTSTSTGTSIPACPALASPAASSMCRRG